MKRIYQLIFSFMLLMFATSGEPIKASDIDIGSPPVCNIESSMLPSQPISAFVSSNELTFYNLPVQIIKYESKYQFIKAGNLQSHSSKKKTLAWCDLGFLFISFNSNLYSLVNYSKQVKPPLEYSLHSLINKYHNSNKFLDRHRRI